ncbi:hypothetical protein LJR255_003915 [Pararhizobium sp. LjRoot255]|uniref:hypothetical protein n=1 Tax=Pararhizobium sp. LjRoot255 TaxID=3342298 RepID=UPI003ED1379E
MDTLVGHQTESAKGVETAAVRGLAESRSLRLIFFPLLVIDVGLSDHLHTDHQKCCRRDAADRRS